MTTVLTTPINDGSSIRILLVAPLAAFTTAVLVMFMYKLVVTNFVAPKDKPELIIPEVTWEEPVVETILDKSKPELNETVEMPPVILPNEGPVDDGMDVTIPTTGAGTFELTFNPNSTNNSYPIARVMVGAQYPSTAAARGIEGYVDVQFDVAASGATENIQVVGYEPSTIFNRAATRAAAKWKFQPKMIDGKPVRFEGMVKRVRFEMQK